MSTVSASIQELFKSGQTPSKICKLLKGRVSRPGVYKALKSFETFENNRFGPPEGEEHFKTEGQNTKTH